MVTLQSSVERTKQLDLEVTLQDHWMLDRITAQELAYGVSRQGRLDILELCEWQENYIEPTMQRDRNREEITRTFSGESEKSLFIIGPCSLDVDTDYGQLFDYIEELQERHPEAVIAWRGNGAKPRSRGGNTGVFNNTASGSRRKQLEAYQEAYGRGIPILAEITDKDQFGVLAPYLSGVWLGARDMGSTDLRTMLSATRLPVMVKNGVDGNPKTLEDALTAIGKNTTANDGSGVNLGYIAYTCRHEDGGPSMLTVGEGNKNVAVVARGYDMPESMGHKERHAAAIEHLGEICTLAARVGCAAILDGSHEVPRMFSFSRKDGDRFLKVLKIFSQAIRRNKIENAGRIRGFLGEISVSVGITDVNYVISDENKEEMTSEIDNFQALLLETSLRSA